MHAERLERTGDAITFMVTADDGSKHRVNVWPHDDVASDGAAIESEALEFVRAKLARANLKNNQG